MKMIVIGLDGATWSLIEPWAQQGLLPTFAKIRAAGCSGVLKSTNPPLTSPGWPSFFTGKNPGKHGVYDFIAPHGRTVQNGAAVRTETLWEILSRHGKKCIVQNVPLTFPPRAINGIMITDMLAAPGEIFTHPAELTKILNAEGYKIDVLFDRPKEKRKEAVVKLVNDIEQNHVAVFKKLITQEQWDFAMLTITGMDRLQHYYWDDTQTLLEHYQLVDRLIGDIMRDHPDATFVFLSDHGFCTKKTQLDLNLWLEQEGYLRWKKDDTQETGSWMDQKYYAQKNGGKSGLKMLFKKIGITHETVQRYPLLRKIVHLLPRHLRKKIGSVVAQTTRSPDWQHTRAFIPTGIVRGININLAGREAHGMVPAGEYESVRDEIIAKLSTVTTPDGARVFRRVLKREEVYSGPFIHEAYDILFELAQDDVLPIAKKNTTLFSASDHAGYHHEDGMFALIGDTIVQASCAARLEDLAPTILAWYGLPVPAEMDGKVISRAFQNAPDITTETQTEKMSITQSLSRLRL